MKIGILSMQKILNYGSFLQALSLKMQLEQRGHDVYFIDIQPGRKIVDAEPEKMMLSSKFDKYIFKRIENYLLSKKMSKIHKNDYTQYLHTEKCLNEGELFDLAVIGSDEVFNATTPSRWGFSSQLFGNIKNAKKIVTYAASCGHTTYESAKKYGITSEIAQAMNKLSKVSVRDRNTYEFVNKISGVEPIINVDPVFLTDYDPFIPEIETKKPYLLVYAYANRISDENEISAIKAYAKKHCLEVFCIGMQQRWCSHNKPASAFELLRYVKNATCVVTDTFHGTVFSIKYNKKFATLIRDSNRNKLVDLLSQFGLMGRSVDDTKRLDLIMEESIEYEMVNRYIEQEKAKAGQYLDQICLSE